MGQEESKPAEVTTYQIDVPENVYLSDKVDASLKEFAKDVVDYRDAKAFRSAFRMSAERSQEVANAFLPFANPEQIASFQEWQQAFVRAIGKGILISGGSRAEQFDITIKSVATGEESKVSTKSSGVRDDILKILSEVVPTITPPPVLEIAETEAQADQEETAEPLKKRPRLAVKKPAEDTTKES
jgi:hypothetical protein